MIRSTHTKTPTNDMTEPRELTAAELEQVYGGVSAQLNSESQAAPLGGPQIGIILGAVSAAVAASGAVGFHFTPAALRV